MQGNSIVAVQSPGRVIDAPVIIDELDDALVILLRNLTVFENTRVHIFDFFDARDAEFSHDLVGDIVRLQAQKLEGIHLKHASLHREDMKHNKQVLNMIA